MSVWTSMRHHSLFPRSFTLGLFLWFRHHLEILLFCWLFPFYSLQIILALTGWDELARIREDSNISCMIRPDDPLVDLGSLCSSDLTIPVCPVLIPSYSLNGLPSRKIFSFQFELQDKFRCSVWKDSVLQPCYSKHGLCFRSSGMTWELTGNSVRPIADLLNQKFILTRPSGESWAH